MRKVLLWLSGAAVGVVFGVRFVLRGKYALLGFKHDISASVNKVLLGYSDDYDYMFVRRYSYSRPDYRSYRRYADFER